MSTIKSPRDPSQYGRDERGTPPDSPRSDEERIDEAIDESFPASDPPAPLVARFDLTCSKRGSSRALRGQP